MWLRLAALWLYIVLAVLVASLGYLGWDSLVGIVILAMWVSAMALGSGRALRAAHRVGSVLDRIRSCRPATRAALVISIGIGVVVLRNILAP